MTQVREHFHPLIDTFTNRATITGPTVLKSYFYYESKASTEDDLEAIISGDFNTHATELPTSSTCNMSSIGVSAHGIFTYEAAS